VAGIAANPASTAPQTLGEAWKLGWRVRARCLWGGPGTHSRHKRIAIECDTTIELDMATLVWTRGSKFPLDQLHGRLKCPNCGERRMEVHFEVPGEPKARAVGCASKPARRASPRSRAK
jgi:low affinity Fe/Cu permease